MAAVPKSPRKFTPLVDLSILCVVGALFPTCGETPVINDNSGLSLKGAEMVMTDFVRHGYKKGKLEFDLTAREGFVFFESPAQKRERLAKKKAEADALRAASKPAAAGDKTGDDEPGEEKDDADDDEVVAPSAQDAQGKPAQKKKNKKKKKGGKKKKKGKTNQLDYSFVYLDDPSRERVLLQNFRLGRPAVGFTAAGKTIATDYVMRHYEKGVFRNRVTSRMAYIDNATNDLHLEGRVVMTTHDGKVLETEYVKYNAAIDKLHTMDDVKITSESGILVGGGMVADADLDWVQILGPAGLANRESASKPEPGSKKKKKTSKKLKKKKKKNTQKSEDGAEPDSDGFDEGPDASAANGEENE